MLAVHVRARPAVLVLALLGGLVTANADARVLLIVVDGLDAHEVTDDATPMLARAWRETRWCPGASSVASMPTRTNSNHATLITGVHPEAHGITGNAVWDRAQRRVRKLGVAADLLTETTFTLARRAGLGLRTAAAVGKPKLGLMFAADGVRQAAPDELWDARAASDSAKDDVTGYAYDGTTLAAARALVEHAGVDFLFINLADVERMSHGSGPQSPQAIETRRRTDAALAAFLDWLAARPDWQTTTVIITADHGFDSISNPPIRFGDALADARLTGFQAVGDGGTGHVYLEPKSTPERDGKALAAARRVALAIPGIAEALYLRPNPTDGGARDTVTAVHPDWHLRQERAGDLLLVAKRGFVLVDGSSEEAKLIGNHGGPGERLVPAIVLGGTIGHRATDCEHITAADIGRTVQACLGLPEVLPLDGRAVLDDERGHVLDGICPTSPATPRASPTLFTPS
jgi:type I phosphodiesterase/nucleotide pyrophosphatase